MPDHGEIEKNPAELNYTVVGGGNASHVMVGMLSAAGARVKVWASFKDEAARFKEGMERNGGVQVTGVVEMKGTPADVTKDPGQGLADADVILMALPSFAVNALLPIVCAHCKDGALIGYMPGQGGADWAASVADSPVYKAIHQRDVVLFGTIPMPFNCRIEEFGARVNLLALKPTLHLATYPADIDAGLSRLLCRVSEFVLGDKAAADMYRSFISIHLSTGNANVHLPRLYALFKDFEKGMSSDENPLFYEGMDDYSVNCIQRVSDERMAVAKAIDGAHDKFKGTSADVISTMDVLLELYGDFSEDTSSMLGIFRTNPGYRGLRCPMSQLPDGKWVPDFNNRYFCEDLPFGLVNFKSIALLVGVETPFIDEIILWAQRHLGMELLVRDAAATANSPAVTSTPAPPLRSALESTPSKTSSGTPLRTSEELPECREGVGDYGCQPLPIPTIGQKA